MFVEKSGNSRTLAKFPRETRPLNETASNLKNECRSEENMYPVYDCPYLIIGDEADQRIDDDSKKQGDS